MDCDIFQLVGTYQSQFTFFTFNVQQMDGKLCALSNRLSGGTNTIHSFRFVLDFAQIGSSLLNYFPLFFLDEHNNFIKIKCVFFIINTSQHLLKSTIALNECKSLNVWARSEQTQEKYKKKGIQKFYSLVNFVFVVAGSSYHSDEQQYLNYYKRLSLDVMIMCMQQMLLIPEKNESQNIL